jgi:hypothetical protein
VGESVLRLEDTNSADITALLLRYGLRLETVDEGDIPGSFWGDEEAGLIGDRLYARGDTPIHSILHEACHYICMDQARRAQLDTDAEGDYDEENGVCYLQILLADHVPKMGRERMLNEMDAWGYTFRLGSARDWFERDASDALEWLRRHALVNNEQPSFRLRQ